MKDHQTSLISFKLRLQVASKSRPSRVALPCTKAHTATQPILRSERVPASGDYFPQSVGVAVSTLEIHCQKVRLLAIWSYPFSNPGFLSYTSSDPSSTYIPRADFWTITKRVRPSARYRPYETDPYNMIQPFNPTSPQN